MACGRAAIVVVAMVLAACGSESGDDAVPAAVDAAATGAATTVSSPDGLATLDLPAGALPDGVEVEITSFDLPDDVADPDGRLVAYELEPSGVRLAEPATLTIRRTDDEAGLPLAQILLGDTLDDLEPLDTSVRREGASATATATASVEHFSVTVAFWSGNRVQLSPAVGRAQVDDAFLLAVDPRTESGEGARVIIEPVAEGVVAPAQDVSYSTWRMRCLKETDGILENGYTVVLFSYSHPPQVGEPGALLPEVLGVGGGVIVNSRVELSGDVECLARDGGKTGGDDETEIDDETEGDDETEIDDETGLESQDMLPMTLDTTAFVTVDSSLGGTISTLPIDGQTISVGAFGDGGRMVFRGPLTGALRPDGNGGAFWEDTVGNFLVDGEERQDSQELTDIRFESNAIVAAVRTVDENGVENSFEARFEVPTPWVDWFTALPAFGEVPDEVRELTVSEEDGMLFVSGSGPPDAVLEIVAFGEDGARRTKVTTDGQGDFEVSLDRPAGDASSIAVFVLRGSHQLARGFLE